MSNLENRLKEMNNEKAQIDEFIRKLNACKDEKLAELGAMIEEA